MGIGPARLGGYGEWRKGYSLFLVRVGLIAGRMIPRPFHAHLETRSCLQTADLGRPSFAIHPIQVESMPEPPSNIVFRLTGHALAQR